MDATAILIGICVTILAAIISPAVILTMPRWFPVSAELASDPERLRRRLLIAAVSGWLVIVVLVWVELALIS